jgi:hypothetical protein
MVQYIYFKKRDPTMKKYSLLLSVFLALFTSIAFAQTPTALLKVGTFKDMGAISVGDGMTPDHIPSGASVVVACYFSEGKTESILPSKIGDLYAPGAPYRYIYEKANTVVYDTAIHQKQSPTYGRKNDRTRILADAKDLKTAFNNDKKEVANFLPMLQKTRDANNKPTDKFVTAGDVEKALTALDSANTKAGIYDATKLKAFCKK